MVKVDVEVLRDGCTAQGTMVVDVLRHTLLAALAVYLRAVSVARRTFPLWPYSPGASVPRPGETCSLGCTGHRTEGERLLIRTEGVQCCWYTPALHWAQSTALLSLPQAERYG